MTALSAGAAADALALPVELEPVPDEQVLAGSPSTGWTMLDARVGVWEMTPGSMRDVEEDEVLIVLAGSATVAFDEPALPDVELRPGSIMRLRAGMRTRWTVHETLRKVFLA
ncbi:cupin domain-containing protein [Agrococcus sp. ProA11]|uniref:cupin domain-containing protein n=1 Tax=Agrococcus chionoecetis TaxID=3153752 RepID=UPI0032610C1D